MSSMIIKASNTPYIITRGEYSGYHIIALVRVSQDTEVPMRQRYPDFKEVDWLEPDIQALLLSPGVEELSFVEVNLDD